MPNRRKFLLTLTAAFLGMALVVASVIADELLGVITKADPDAKKITVVEKDTDKEIEIKITDDTEYVAGKNTGKVDFEKLEKGIEKAKEKGRKRNRRQDHARKVSCVEDRRREKEKEGRVSRRTVVQSAGKDARQLSARHSRRRSGQDFVDDIAIHVRETIIAAGVAVGEAR